MIKNGGNTEWCKPLKHKSEAVYLVVYEGDIANILDNGNYFFEFDKIEEKIKELAKRLNPEHDEYEGWDDTHILLDSDFEELGCNDCPWFDLCDAMEDNY